MRTGELAVLEVRDSSKNSSLRSWMCTQSLKQKTDSVFAISAATAGTRAPTNGTIFQLSIENAGQFWADDYSDCTSGSNPSCSGHRCPAKWVCTCGNAGQAEFDAYPFQTMGSVRPPPLALTRFKIVETAQG